MRQVKARRFFRIYADACYGYLARKKKERTLRKEVEKARDAYITGIENAWRIYTENNDTAKKARKVLDETIHKAHGACYRENVEQMSREAYEAGSRYYVKATRKAYEDYAEAVNDTWEDFVKDMECLPST